MIGAKIKKLRVQQGMTQKNLADKLFVSAQAVSRWENDEVEPSIGTITEMAKIFGVTADEILGIDSPILKEEKTSAPKNEPTRQEKIEIPKQFLAVCESCNRPIYESKEIVRCDGTVLCSKCDKSKKDARHRMAVEAANKRRVCSFIFGTLATVAMLILTFSIWSSLPAIGLKIGMIVFSLLLFTFVSCCILNNNFVGEMFITMCTWGFVRFPGLIFTFDLDGCLWLIGMKILFGILGFLIGAAAFAFALLIGSVVSPFVYPYAIKTNRTNPEKVEL